MSDYTYFQNNEDENDNNNDVRDDENNDPEMLPLETTRDDINLDETESVLFISYQNRRIAFAFYRIGSSRIELFHEMYEFDDYVVTRNVLAKLQPDNVFIGAQCESKLYWLLKKLSSNFCEEIVTIMTDEDDTNNSNEPEDSSIQQTSENEDATNSVIKNDEENFSFTLEGDTTLNLLNNHFKLHIVPSKLFNYEQCKSRILSFDFKPISHQSDKTIRYIYLTSQIDFSETNTIRSLGVLLFFIEKQSSTLSANANINSISDFVYFFLDCFVSIDQITYDALDIFKNEWHPSLSKKGLTKKESFSLYGVFNSCASKIGSNYLRKIFLQPLTNIDILEERLDVVEFFHCEKNSYFKTSVYDFLKNIKHIPPIINRFRSSNFQISDFRTLQQNLIAVISIKNLFTNRLMNSEKKIKIFDKITDHFIMVLNEILESIENTIDFDKSKDDGKVAIKTGIDEELDKKKFYFNKLPEILRNAIDEQPLINDLVQTHNIDITLLYLPQLGFLLKLSLIEVQKITDIDKYELRFLFCAETAAYYKNANTDQYDSLFGDIHGEINDLTHQNLVKLKEFIIERIDTLIMANSYCAFLDAMIAISQSAIDMNFTRPKLNCQGMINIVEGRHPLYEIITKSFVPNDYHCDSKSSKTMIIFGQNGSGKTVYLKQICLIVFLAHIGSFVPAQSAELQVVDKIFTRIRTPESISTQLSSFKLDLNQMIAATKYAKRRSLVIIDCFGKGTLYVDGYALLKGFINYWINNDQQPYLIISTHYNMLLTTIEQDVEVVLGRFDNEFQNYKLKLCQKNDEELSAIPTAPELIDLCNKVCDEKQKKESIAEIKTKFRSYIQLADMILNNEQLDKINSFAKDIISKYHTNKGK
ncbi:mutS protein-like protein [Euroglyphus maynei]|uniref:MutS protein-like protein n=1 Tax=Euroglyphus maynei TaxID=6958 RepID=A0A1Y3B5N2_EURMA|nr:mutS protein-like protein [Euroglyphus maynei]